MGGELDCLSAIVLFFGKNRSRRFNCRAPTKSRLILYRDITPWRERFDTNENRLSSVNYSSRARNVRDELYYGILRSRPIRF